MQFLRLSDTEMNQHHHHTPTMCIYNEDGSIPYIHAKTSFSLCMSSPIGD